MESGKASALGETLAKMTLFHFVLGTVMKFKIERPPGDSFEVERLNARTSIRVKDDQQKFQASAVVNKIQTLKLSHGHT